MVLVCSWERIVRLRIDSRIGMVIIIIYLEEMYIKIKSSVFLLSVWYSHSSSMVNVFGDSIASGPRNLHVVKKVVVTVGKFTDYINEIQQSYELGFTP